MPSPHHFKATPRGTELVQTWDGKWVGTHKATDCSTNNGMTHNCMVHNPSRTPMWGWKLHWDRAVRRMFRVCDDDHFHLDPDDLMYEVLVKGTDSSTILDMVDEHIGDCDCQCCASTLTHFTKGLARRAELQEEKKSPVVSTKGPRLVFGTAAHRDEPF